MYLTKIANFFGKILLCISIVCLTLLSETIQGRPPLVFAEAKGDDYPFTAIDAIDPWRLYTRECTSFAAFRLSHVNGFMLPPAYGNANVWGHRARREGYRVDMNPAIGAIAWWESPMHVAWVSNVYGDSVEIEEYNYGFRHTYNKRSIHKNSVSGYIHFKDMGTASTSPTSSTVSAKLPPSGVYTFTHRTPIYSQANQTSQVLNHYDTGQSVRYDKTIEANGYYWISYISYSGSRRYIPVETLPIQPAKPTENTKQPVTPLPSSGSYTFKERIGIRNQPSMTSPELTYYQAGATVRYDKVVQAEGKQWISYISYSGSRRYIPVETLPIQPAKPTENTKQAASALPPSGSYTFKERTGIRNQPSMTSPELTYYQAGATVRYDKLVQAEGKQWISYVSYSGVRRYIAVP